jgi:hypothetical protein
MYCGTGSIVCGTGTCESNSICTTNSMCQCPTGYQIQACDGTPCNGDYTTTCPGTDLKCAKL